MGETRYYVLCETREKGSERVTTQREEKVRHVSTSLPTQKLKLGSVAPLVPRIHLRAANSG